MTIQGDRKNDRTKAHPWKKYNSLIQTTKMFFFKTSLKHLYSECKALKLKLQQSFGALFLSAGDKSCLL